MKKFIIPLVISTPLFLSASAFAASSSTLYNPELRSDAMYSIDSNPGTKAGASYAYLHHRHLHHWHNWHRNHHWRHYYYYG
ncbi:hypothetical protein [Legionella sp.]|uniref:hypothetical protein n=1 Tax=Legionella sp. TaxID=459 RepID=UPI003C8FC186